MKTQLQDLELDLQAVSAALDTCPCCTESIRAQARLQNALLAVQRLKNGNTKRTSYRDLPITVKITKCDSPNLWYARQVGAVLNVRITKRYLPGYEYKMLGGGYLRKEDCEIITKEPTPFCGVDVAKAGEDKTDWSLVNTQTNKAYSIDIDSVPSQENTKE